MAADEDLPPVDSARRTFKGLNLPRRLTMDWLVVKASEIIGKPISFSQRPPNDLHASARLFVTPSKVIIEYQARLPTILESQCKLHELSHIFLGWLTPEPDYFDVLRGRLAFHRGREESAREESVEILADLLARALRDAGVEPARFEEVFG
ncbi:hypothetical protein [Rathayibacter rathayi]|uniref:hypothetical protein n=1 Tax=Rathayibacter rathayi TaxID=33887 RepID=UPI000CE9030B|nr:hypothetical protein [Rathayibacter rathayi]PPF25112.1 hypothetical protein C5C34_04130 [Rathayibacter rathayi]PPG97499.1 hypothetical protein C5C22_00845 [Rathayibacter rathayi]